MIDSRSKTLVFTDLDGTLLDRNTYSYDQALPALKLLQQKNIPIVFCSAKTRAEQEEYRKELGIHDPFIVENGGAIFIDLDYFPFNFGFHKVIDTYRVIELGTPYRDIRATLEHLRAESGMSFTGFGDMSPEQVSRETGLNLESARRAKKREYDETLKLQGSQGDINRVLKAIRQAGLNYAPGGRFYDVMGPNDKGKASTILINLFRRKLGQAETIGIGDSLNDLPMLSVVDKPVLVQKVDGSWENIVLPGLYKANGPGPEGWSKAIREIFEDK